MEWRARGQRDRHVAQRNVTLLQGTEDTVLLLNRLDDVLDLGAQLTIDIGAARPAQPCWGGGARGCTKSRRPGRAGTAQPAPAPAALPAQKGRSGWSSDRLPSTNQPHLSDLIVALLEVQDTTAAGLMTSPHLAGSSIGALHLGA